jgi:hypothetical protein
MDYVRTLLLPSHKPLARNLKISLLGGLAGPSYGFSEAGLTLETIAQKEEHRQDCIAGAPEISKETPMSTAEPIEDAQPWTTFQSTPLHPN